MLVLTIEKYLSELYGVDESLMARGHCVTSVCVASKMTQPWAFIAENTLSAMVRISIKHLFTRPFGHASRCDVVYWGVFILRCLHTPSAAAALIVVLSQTIGFRYAFFSVFIGSALLILAGAVYGNLTGKSYPNRPK
jgi:CBS domain-containing membrane protein